MVVPRRRREPCYASRMADHYRVLVSWGLASEPVRDWCSNTLYFQHDDPLPIPDYQNLVDDIWDVYAELFWITGRRLDVRIYNMQDGEPRPIRAQKVANVSGTAQPLGPREVACCLSYYGDRNLPRTRGRIYGGPFNGTQMLLRPPTNLLNALIGLGQGLAGIGGENISWRVYSPTTGEYHHIRHIWVNDEWDTMRSRQLRETTRVTADV